MVTKGQASIKEPPPVPLEQSPHVPIGPGPQEPGTQGFQVVVSTQTYFYWGKLVSERDQLKDDNKGLLAEVARLNGLYTALRNDLASVNSEKLKRLEHELEQSNNTAHDLEHELAELKSQHFRDIESLTARHAEDMSKLKEEIGRLALINQQLAEEKRTLTDRVFTLEARITKLEDDFDAREVARRVENLLCKELGIKKSLGMITTRLGQHDPATQATVSAKQEAWWANLTLIQRRMQDFKEDGDLFAHSGCPQDFSATFDLILAELTNEGDWPDFALWLRGKKADVKAATKY